MEERILKGLAAVGTTVPAVGRLEEGAIACVVDGMHEGATVGAVDIAMLESTLKKEEYWELR